MKKKSLLIILGFAIAGCSKQQQTKAQSSVPSLVPATTVSGPFSEQELLQFAKLDPIDTHTHVYQSSPEFLALLQKLNIHIVDILVPHTAEQKDLDLERRQAWEFVRASHGQAVLCSTFDPFSYRDPNFSTAAITEINRDFAQGAVAVKIWKNIGEQVKDAKGNYIMPDNPVFAPIYKDIAAHNKTLIAHVADPNTIWEPPTPAAADYSYYTHHPEWYMYNKAKAPSKEAILRARDHLLEENPNLRVVGAHLGSMEADFNQLGEHLDRYPNFAVDLAARMPYLLKQPRAEMIAFIEKYQDRLIYATDNELDLAGNVPTTVKRWENSYATDWRFFATNDLLQYRDHTVQGLALPNTILHKLYHDNAMHWIPGIVDGSH